MYAGSFEVRGRGTASERPAPESSLEREVRELSQAPMPGTSGSDGASETFRHFGYRPQTSAAPVEDSRVEEAPHVLIAIVSVRQRRS